METNFVFWLVLLYLKLLNDVFLGTNFGSVFVRRSTDLVVLVFEPDLNLYSHTYYLIEFGSIGY